MESSDHQKWKDIVQAKIKSHGFKKNVKAWVIKKWEKGIIKHRITY